MLPTVPARLISLPSGPSTILVADTSRGGRVSPQDGHDQSPTCASTTRAYLSGDLQRGQRVASLIACGTTPPTSGSSTPKKIVFASRRTARFATSGSSALRTSVVVAGRPASASPILFASVSSSKYRSIWSRKRFVTTTTRGCSLPTALGSDASSISNSPKFPCGSPDHEVCARSAAATPRSRFEPDRLWIGSHPAVREMSASIRAVVVLPFVPETHATPYSSSAESA